MFCSARPEYVSSIMESTALRPRFYLHSKLEPLELVHQIRRALKNADVNTHALQQRSVSNHILIVFPRESRHFWSPVMDLNMEREEGGTTVRVLMGPEASVWTMFMFMYTLGGLLVLAGFVLGYAQYILGHSSWYFLLIPSGLVIIALFYAAALAGKYRARQQMECLQHFLKQAMPESF